MTPAREVAFRVLLQVERGGFASDILRNLSKGLDARDAGLAHEIVFGALRYQAPLDFLIEHLSGRQVSRLDVEVTVALRMGLYQLGHLDRVPSHAAVAESVNLVKAARKRSAAGLVNAVLRKAGRQAPPWPDRATEFSMPRWLLERWEAEFGMEQAKSIASAFLRQPNIYVRETSWGPRTQDIGAQSIVPMLDLRPGLSFLDLCAAPGNKTAQALECGVRAVACDLSYRRLEGMRVYNCPLVALDGTRPLPFSCQFDRILVDAPCSGTGTLGRNPEIKWRLRPADLADYQRKQVLLLRNALQLLAPGGRLVYSTCSLEREENQDVVSELLGKAPLASSLRIPGMDAGDGFYAAVIGST
jgi:16S rRNA (cytosine967-C5)-methyltransferase